MSKVRLGIIGLGNMGMVHATNLLAGKVPRRALRGYEPGGSHTAAHATLPPVCATQTSPNGTASVRPAPMNVRRPLVCEI